MGWLTVTPYCLLLPQRFVFPTRRKTKGSLIYFRKRSKKTVHLVKHIIVWRNNIKEVLDDAHIKVHFQRIRWQGNPRTWHPDRHGSTNREYPIPYTCMMTTWVSCYSDNGKPRLKRSNLQAKWQCDTLLNLLILDVRPRMPNLITVLHLILGMMRYSNSHIPIKYTNTLAATTIWTLRNSQILWMIVS